MTSINMEQLELYVEIYTVGFFLVFALYMIDQCPNSLKFKHFLIIAFWPILVPLFLLFLLLYGASCLVDKIINISKIKEIRIKKRAKKLIGDSFSDNIGYLKKFNKKIDNAFKNTQNKLSKSKNDMIKSRDKTIREMFKDIQILLYFAQQTNLKILRIELNAGFIENKKVLVTLLDSYSISYEIFDPISVSYEILEDDYQNSQTKITYNPSKDSISIKDDKNQNDIANSDLDFFLEHWNTIFDNLYNLLLDECIEYTAKKIKQSYDTLKNEVSK